MKEKIVSLAAPFHNTDGSLLTPQNKASKILKSIFDTINVTLTTQSDGRVFRDLEYEGVNVQRREQTSDVGDRYRASLQLALEDPISYLLLIDFDRAIHWALNFEDELRAVVEDLKSSEGFTSMVRSERAFETHPQTQRETEKAVNTIASEIAGRRVDILSGAYGMDQETASLLVKEISKSDFGFFGELLAIPVKNKIKINTLEVEGLEWETPDQYKNQINKIGYTQWLNNFQSLEEWEKRLTLAFEAGSALHEG